MFDMIHMSDVYMYTIEMFLIVIHSSSDISILIGYVPGDSSPRERDLYRMVKKFLYGTFDISHKYTKIPYKTFEMKITNHAMEKTKGVEDVYTRVDLTLDTQCVQHTHHIDTHVRSTTRDDLRRCTNTRHRPGGVWYHTERGCVSRVRT